MTKEDFKKLLKKKKIKIDSDSLEAIEKDWTDDEPTIDKTKDPEKDDKTDPTDIVAILKSFADPEADSKKDDNTELSPVMTKFMATMTQSQKVLLEEFAEMKKGNDEKSKEQKRAEIMKTVEEVGIKEGRIANNDEEKKKWADRIEENGAFLDALKEMPKGAGHVKEDKKTESGDEGKIKHPVTGVGGGLGDKYLNYAYDK
jgi:hypothetical protein